MARSSRRTQIVDGSDRRALRTAPQRLAGAGQLLHHTRMQENLAAPRTAIHPHQHERDVIALAHGPLLVAIALEVATASRATGRSLCAHRFTRFLKSAVQRA